MSDSREDDRSQFLEDLSAQEQETIAGGFGLEDLFGSFFFQKTDIDTFADARTNISNDLSVSRRTGYKLSQITLAFTIPFFGGGGRSSRSRKARMRNIFSLFQDDWGSD
jgi:hypothetical protein